MLIWIFKSQVHLSLWDGTWREALEGQRASLELYSLGRIWIPTKEVVPYHRFGLGSYSIIIYFIREREDFEATKNGILFLLGEKHKQPSEDFFSFMFKRHVKEDKEGGNKDVQRLINLIRSEYNSTLNIEKATETSSECNYVRLLDKTTTLFTTLNGG